MEKVATPIIIDGLKVTTGKSFPVENPADLSLAGQAVEAGPKEVDQAVNSASVAWPAWAGLGIKDRAGLLIRAAEELEKEADDLSSLYSREQGKPIEDARIEYLRVIDYFRSYADLAPRIGPVLTGASDTVTSWTRWRPLGVVGLIIPWNSPLVLAAIKLPAALLAGNTTVLKVPSHVPLALLEIGRIVAGIFPAGVVNFLAGPGQTVGRSLVKHPQVAMISFTGDSDTGKNIMAAAAPTLKRLTLELGGNDPALFLDDAVLDQKHQNRIISACFRNAGQVCMAAKRIYVQRRLLDDFLNWFVPAVKNLSIGPGLGGGVDLGPINNKAQLDWVIKLADEARAAGARFLCGGKRPEDPQLGPGHFYSPTVVLTEDDQLSLVKEEQFGPIVPVLPFDDDLEAVRRANDSRYGLGASVWSRDLARAQKVAAGIEAGVVWINAHSSRFLGPDSSYGGIKDSGLGVEKGLAGIHEYMYRQTMSLVH